MQADWTGSNLFDTLMVFLKEFFKKVDFEKISRRHKKARKILPGGKELIRLDYSRSSTGRFFFGEALEGRLKDTGILTKNLKGYRIIL